MLSSHTAVRAALPTICSFAVWGTAACAQQPVARAASVSDICQLGDEITLRGTADHRLLSAALPWLDPRRVYFADRLSSKLLVFDHKGQLIRTVGTRGTAPGEYEMPYSVQSDETGWVYVNDRGNGRVQVLDQGLQVLRVIAAPGQNEQLIVTRDADAPSIVMLGNSSCPESDATADACLVRQFDHSGRMVRAFATEPTHPVMHSSQAAMGPDRSVYLANVLGDAVHVYGENGKRRRIIRLDSPSMRAFAASTAPDMPADFGTILQRLRDESHTRIRSLVVAEKMLFVQFQRVKPAAGESQFVLDVYSLDGALRLYGIATPGILTASGEGPYFVAHRSDGDGAISIRPCGLR